MQYYNNHRKELSWWPLLIFLFKICYLGKYIFSRNLFFEALTSNNGAFIWVE
jgi:hypothetical protein